MSNQDANIASARARAWDHYWRDGRLASCGGEGGAGYQDAIAIGWRTFFSELPNASRILDVCSGNGAIARLAERVAQERGMRFSIDAVDAAQLVPPGIGVGMIAFHSRIAAEQLPFATNSFDVVVGQYAVEYTELARSLPELARVSRADCRLRFLVHASEGVVVGGALSQLAEVMQLRGSGIFTVAAALAHAQNNPDSTPQSMYALRRQYHDAADKVAQAAASSVEPQMFTNTIQVFNHALSVQAQVGLQPIVEKIAEVESSISAHASRLEAMTQAALDTKGAHDLAKRIGQCWGKSLHVDACARADGALLGWVIETIATM